MRSPSPGWALSGRREHGAEEPDGAGARSRERERGEERSGAAEGVRGYASGTGRDRGGLPRPGAPAPPPPCPDRPAAGSPASRRADIR